LNQNCKISKIGGPNLWEKNRKTTIMIKFKEEQNYNLTKYIQKELKIKKEAYSIFKIRIKHVTQRAWK